MGNLKECEFSEAEFQSLIEFIFRAEFSRGVRFKIKYYSGTDERIRGYDIAIGSYIPVYLQMKRSNFYKNGANSPAMNQRLTSFHYKDDPGAFFFGLHVDETNKEYQQHNLLADLYNSGQYARYIAPFFLSDSEMEDLKYRLSTLRWGIYGKSLRFGKTSRHFRNYFDLDCAITIPATRQLSKSAGVHHKYFYNFKSEISLHSEGEKIESKGENDLSYFFDEIKGRFETSEGELTFAKAYSSLFNVVSKQYEQYIGLPDLVENLNWIFERQGLEGRIENYENLIKMEPTWSIYQGLCIILKERFNIYTYMFHSNDLVTNI